MEFPCSVYHQSFKLGSMRTAVQSQPIGARTPTILSLSLKSIAHIRGLYWSGPDSN
jgi:hypothetical protein